MHILITGGTGFIGTQLCRHLTKLEHKVSILTRNPYKNNNSSQFVHYVTELNSAAAYDVIINLAGESLNKNRWNTKVKSRIYESRIQTTQKIIDYIKTAIVKPQLLISSSAIGFYGSSPDQVFTEESRPADKGFTNTLCHDWETTAMQASQYGVRVCLIRTGIVLGKDGGALKQMIIPFKLGLGAQFGDGMQWMSWIHIDDVIESIAYIIDKNDLKGAFNLTAPEPVSNKLFTLELAKILKRPRFLTFPNLMVKIMFGQMGEYLLLNGQKVIPDKLMQTGYSFKYSKLEDALKNILL